jgi:hypothetical protein
MASRNPRGFQRKVLREAFTAAEFHRAVVPVCHPRDDAI